MWKTTERAQCQSPHPHTWQGDKKASGETFAGAVGSSLVVPEDSNAKQHNLMSCSLWQDVLASGGLCCPPLRAAQLAARVVQSCPEDSMKYLWNLI